MKLLYRYLQATNVAIDRFLIALLAVAIVLTLWLGFQYLSQSGGIGSVIQNEHNRLVHKVNKRAQQQLSILEHRKQLSDIHRVLDQRLTVHDRVALISLFNEVEKLPGVQELQYEVSAPEELDDTMRLSVVTLSLQLDHEEVLLRVIRQLDRQRQLIMRLDELRVDRMKAETSGRGLLSSLILEWYAIDDVGGPGLSS